MIELNLLPESKLQNVKAKQTEHKILGASILASIAAIGILILSLLAVGVQKYSLSSSQNDITKYTDQFNQISGVNAILTTQNQLKTLIRLHASDPAATRLFTYLPQITPTAASVSQLTINFDQNTITVNGTATSLQAVNEFADTLKFTTYTTGTQASAKAAFTSVVLSNFGVNSAGASYSFQLSYDPVLFQQSQSVKLSVPQNYITTRSFIELPNSALFSTSSKSNGASK